MTYSLKKIKMMPYKKGRKITRPSKTEGLVPFEIK